MVSFSSSVADVGVPGNSGGGDGERGSRSVNEIDVLRGVVIGGAGGGVLLDDAIG